MSNLKLAVRTLARSPFVTAVAVASLALGIGANAGIYSLFEQILIRPLPVLEPNRLVNLSAPGPKPGSTSCGQAGPCEDVMSYPMFRDLEKASTGVLSQLAAHVNFGANLAFKNQTRSASGSVVSGSYFPALRVQPHLGRLITPNDDQVVDGSPVAVLSYRYWQATLGADPSVVNAPITVNGKPFTVIGVAPESFKGTVLGDEPDVFVPLTMISLARGGDEVTNRRSYWAYVFGRLKPGVTMEGAQAALNTTYKQVINDVEASLQQGMSDSTLARFRAKTLTLSEGRRGQSDLLTGAKTPLVLLLTVTAIVLLIACANIANLLLARGAGRSTEMAVRLSLGAQRRQVMSQLLVEALLLAGIAGVLSIGIAKATLIVMYQMLPPQANQVIHLDLRWSVVLFAGMLALLTGLLFGLFPALHSTRPDLITGIRANANQPSGARAANRFRTGLVIAQIALAMMLLATSGLFIKSLVNVTKVNLGMKVDDMVTFSVRPGRNGYPDGRSKVLLAQINEGLGALPGVRGVTAARVPFLGGNNWGNDVSVEGFTKGPDTDAGSRFNQVGTGYFTTMGVSLLGGRDFTAADDSGAPRVAIVNEAFANKFGLGKQPVGKRMTNNAAPGAALNIEIVGLVPNVKYSEVKDDIPPVFYLPYRQDDNIGGLHFYVRTASEGSAAVMSAIPGLVNRIDATLPVEELKLLEQQVKDNIFLDRVISTMSSGFAALATLLAAIGLYGVLAYTIAQRTREIGVRMALGANVTQVQGLVMRQVGMMTVIGGVVGTAAALGLGKLASSLLFGLKGSDPIVLVLAASLLAGVALLAGYLPARKASRIHPVQALRYE